MDNTTNSQDPQQTPQAPQVSPPVEGQAPVQNQPQVQNPVPPVQPQMPSQQAVPNLPVVDSQTGQSAQTVQSSAPQAQPPASKITLDDLYGPSGLAEDAPQQPVPVQPLPQSPTPEPQVAIPTPPIEQPASPVQQVEQPPMQPVPSPVSTAPQEPIVELAPDLPLRKSAMSMQQEEPVVSAPVIKEEKTEESTKSENPKNGGKKGINKVLLLRFLFGGVAVIVLLVVLMFVVTFLSSVFHPATSGKVTLTYWGLWEDSNTMQAAISAFEKDHPNISIQYEKEDPKDYSQRLLTRIQQGNGPDIFTYHSSWLPMVQAALVPLPTSVVSKNELENNFYPVVSRDVVKNGAIYGIPLGIDTLSLFVNNALFKNAKVDVPTSWDNFTSVARALTEKDDTGKIKVAGAAIGTFDNITHAPDIVSLLFVQNGVDITSLTPANNASDALSFYTSFATGDSKVWDSTLDPSQLAFAKGNLAMYFGYSWDIFILKAANPTLDFSIHPVPHLPGRNTTIASYWVQGVSGKSAHQKEAFEFMHFLAQKNTQALLYSEEAKTRLFGEPYARSDLGATLSSNPIVYPFVLQGKDAVSSFFAGETQDTGLNSQMNGYLGNAVRAVLSNTSADSALDPLTQGVKQVENQYASQ